MTKWTESGSNEDLSKKTPHKPYWSCSLSASWEEMRAAHKDYKRSFGSNRQKLLERYRFYRKKFNKDVKRAVKNHINKIFDDLEKLDKRQPGEFCGYINRITGKQHTEIDLCVQDNQGNIVHNVDLTLAHWEKEFQSILPGRPTCHSGWRQRQLT